MNKFKIGEFVWAAHYGQTQVKKNCHVCFGKLEVTLILGNGDKVVLPCDYCAKGYDAPRGFDYEYEYIVEPVQVRIDSIIHHETTNGIKTEVRTTPYLYDQEDLFPNKEDAMSRSKEKAEQKKAEQEQSIEWLKKSKKASFAWNAGYHLKEVNNLKKKIEYHERKAQLCKARTK